MLCKKDDFCYFQFPKTFEYWKNAGRGFVEKWNFSHYKVENISILFFQTEAFQSFIAIGLNVVYIYIVLLATADADYQFTIPDFEKTTELRTVKIYKTKSCLESFRIIN